MQLREAYHRKVQETHPDKLSNLGLSPDLVKFAHERMARINEAYNKIRMARRKAAAAAVPRRAPLATATRRRSRRRVPGAPDSGRALTGSRFLLDCGAPR